MQVFVACLGDYVPVIKIDKKGNLFKFVRQLLSSPSCMRLYGLLTHFCYWNIVHPAARAAIKETIAACNSNLLPQINSNSNNSNNNNRANNTVNASNSPHLFGSSGSLGSSSISALFEAEIDRADNALSERVNLPEVLRQSQLEKDVQLREVSNFINDNIQRNRALASSPTNGRPNTANLVEQIFTDATDGFEEDIPIHDLSANMEDSLGFEEREQRTIQFVENIELENSQKSSHHSSRLESSNNVPVRNTFNNTLHILDGMSVASEASLSKSEKEQLFLQLEYCLVKIFQKLAFRKMFLVAGRQVRWTALFVFCVKIVIIFRP